MNRELKNYLNILDSRRDYLKKTYNVKKIGIFGSTARGDRKKSSDIDILVEFSEAPCLFEFVRLQRYLRGILKKKVDLATKKALKPIIKKDILRETIYV
ncbi:nucleotidyltransferase family protein [Candidatus Parcubacteria bacterium]|nr:nucleotidyltransferase family protein [Candidatus Parcubacteria bacterium]